MDTHARAVKTEILNTVTGLELVARVVVEGFMSGANKAWPSALARSLANTETMSPAMTCASSTGRCIARSERYYIKQAEIETNITVKFMIDASHSMAYKEQHISKLQRTPAYCRPGYLARKRRYLRPVRHKQQAYHLAAPALRAAAVHALSCTTL